MRFMRWLWVVVLALAVGAPEVDAAPGRFTATAVRPHMRRAPSIFDNSSHMDVNNLDMIVTNHGSFAYDLEGQVAGLIFPAGSGNEAVFAGGLWIGAKVGGQIRVAVATYGQEFTPGPMAGGTFQSSTDPRFRNYKLLRDQGTGLVDTTDFAPDPWPRDHGAPTDSTGAPGLLGDMMIWSAYNDADPALHVDLSGSTAPLGVEVQQSTFAFNRTGALQNIIFVKFKIINKGGNQLDETYLSLWADPDLGGFTDDLVGCDTTLSLGYCYNSNNNDQQYGASPPAVGFDFFRGPIVPSTLFPGTMDTLGMTSFNKYTNATDPLSAQETYNYMSGLDKAGNPIHEFDNPANPITRYQVSGDPVTNTGWLDDTPGDRRLFLTAGPFTMFPNDSQEVVAAIIIGQGADRLSSITDLRNKDDAAQLAFDTDFVLPPPVPPPTDRADPMSGGIHLTWGSEPLSYVGAGSGKEFHFEGFQVWQYQTESPGSPRKLLATYDVPDGLTKLYVDENNPTSGGVERMLVAPGDDGGLKFSLDVTNDAFGGGALVDYRDYYFAVTAYAYEINSVQPYAPGEGDVVEFAESAVNLGNPPIRVQPQPITSTFSNTITQTGGTPDAGKVVEVEQVVQRDLTGDLYRIQFADDERWTLTNQTDGTTLLADTLDLSAGVNTPIIEGFLTRISITRSVTAVNEAFPGGVLRDMTPNNTDSTGVWYLDTAGAPILSRFVRFPANLTHGRDYEIRVLADTTDNCWEFVGGDPSPEATFKVPFEVWDLGLNSVGNPADDQKICVMALDADGNGRWNWGDGLYVREIPYASVAWGTPGHLSTDYSPNNTDQTLGRFFFELSDLSFVPEWPAQTTLRILNRKFSAADRFEFRTVPPAGPGSGGPGDVKRILAVPNPYYAYSKYELDRFNRVVKFTHIPSDRRVTIRIFNLAGDLVRTLRAEPNDPNVVATSAIVWDLNTERALPVASGVYIFHVDVAGLGTKTDRLAVFVERERLDSF
jgi:hypothetical protein